MRLLVIALFLSCLLIEPVFAQVDLVLAKEKSASCVACHGTDGNTTLPGTPKLAGQHAGYFIKQITDYKNGNRSNPIMAGIVSSLTESDTALLAAYYASQKTTIGAALAPLAELGQKLYRGGNREKGIAACSACHSPTGNGNLLADFPVLHGQNADYTSAQLKAFRDGQRRNDQNHMMRDIAAKLSDKEIVAVASYISGLH